MPDYSEITNKALADMVRDEIDYRFFRVGMQHDILQEVICRLEKSDGLPSGIEEALNMGDGTYRP
jgi:hypothetical protein